MAETVYILCAATSLLCAIMLWRGFARTKARLLLWSCLCFVLMCVNNLLLCLDKLVLPDVTALMGIEFPLLRSIPAFLGMAILLFGLIWDSE